MEKALEAVLVEIKETGDKALREAMIADYVPFIIKTVSGYTGRYVHVAHSEEYAVALEAFNEAIDRYELDRGKFISYAQLVMTSRLKDLSRRRHRQTVVAFGEQTEIVSDENLEREAILRQEINLLKQRLSHFGITFEKLEDAMPVHQQTRENAIRVAQLIASDDSLYGHLERTSQIPRKDIRARMNVSDKQLKRSRIYIIAVSVVIREDLGTIREIVQL